MGIYRNLTFAALLDDSNNPIPLGGVGVISEARAQALMISRTDGALELVGQRPTAQPPSPPVPAPVPEKAVERAGATSDAEMDIRATALQLSPADLKTLGRSLGLRSRISGIRARLEAWPSDELEQLQKAVDQITS